MISNQVIVSVFSSNFRLDEFENRVYYPIFPYRIKHFHSIYIKKFKFFSANSRKKYTLSIERLKSLTYSIKFDIFKEWLEQNFRLEFSCLEKFYELLSVKLLISIIKLEESDSKFLIDTSRFLFKPAKQLC